MKELNLHEMQQVSAGFLPAVVAVATIVGPKLCEAIALYGAYQLYHMAKHDRAPTFNEYVMRN